jgi:hypothetical protein
MKSSRHYHRNADDGALGGVFVYEFSLGVIEPRCPFLVYATRTRINLWNDLLYEYDVVYTLGTAKLFFRCDITDLKLLRRLC